MLPLKIKLASIMYTMERSFSSSRANSRFPAVKMLKLQFAVLSPFNP
jgi:hypothetical protein